MSGPSKVSCCAEVWYIHSFSGVVRFTIASPLCTPAHLGPLSFLPIAPLLASCVLAVGGGDMLSSDSVHTEYSNADTVQTLSVTVLLDYYGRKYSVLFYGHKYSVSPMCSRCYLLSEG